MEKSIKSSAINYGIYLGILLVLFTVLGYSFHMPLLVNFWFIFLILPIIIIVFGILSTAKAKSYLGGFISFKQAFTSFFITVAIGIIISTIVSYLLFNLIDPEAGLQLKEIALDKTADMMRGFGAPESEIDKVLVEAEKKDSQSLSAQLLQLAQSLIFFAVIGLIVALSFKKTDPNAA